MLRNNLHLRAVSLSIFCFFIYSSFAIAQSLEIPLVSVEGSAIIYEAPDEVHFSFTVETASQEIAEARKKNREIVKEAIDFMSSNKVARKYIQSQYMSVGKNYRKNRKIAEGYIATQTIFVCLTDLKSYDDIADGLLQMKISRLSGPTFKSSNITEVKNKARKNAMLNAQSKAKILAAALGQNIGKAKLISEVRYQSNRNTGAYSSGTETAKNEDVDGLGFAPGQLEVRALVNVSFKLLD